MFEARWIPPTQISGAIGHDIEHAARMVITDVAVERPDPYDGDASVAATNGHQPRVKSAHQNGNSTKFRRISAYAADGNFYAYPLSRVFVVVVRLPGLKTWASVRDNHLEIQSKLTKYALNMP